MAQTENINIQVQAQTEQAQSNIDGLQGSIDNLIKSVNGLGDSMSKNIDATNKLGKSTGELDKSIASNTKTMNLLKGVINDLVPGFGAAADGVISLKQQLTTLETDSLVVIFIAIVAAAELIFKAFTDNVGASDKLAQVWSGISLVMTTLKEAAYALVRAFVDLVEAAVDFATFDFSGAAEKIKQSQEEGKKAVDKTTDALGGQFDAMMKITAAQQENDRAKEVFTNTEKSLQAQLAKSREILNDTTASIAEKTKALKESEQLEKQIAGTKTKFAQKDFDLQQQRLALLGVEAKSQDDINKLIETHIYKGQQLTDDQYNALKKLNELNGVVIDTTTEQAHTELNLDKQRKKLQNEQKQLKDKQISDDKKRKEEHKKELQNELKDIKDKDELAVLSSKEGSEEELKTKEKELDDEKLYYDKHWKELGLSKAEYELKIKQLDKKKEKDQEDFRKKKEKDDLTEIKAQDELSILNAKTDKERLDAKVKQLDDVRKEELSNENLTAAQKLLIQANYEKNKKKLIDDDIKQQNELQKKRDEDIIKTIKDQEDVLKKEVGNSLDKTNKLKQLAQDEHDAKLKLLTDEYNATLAIMTAKGEDTTALTAKFNADQLANDADTKSKQKKLDSDLTDFRIKTMDSIGNAATSLTNLLGKNTAIGKDIAIAQATIDTYGAATKALNAKYSPEGTTDMILRIAAVTSTIANGLASIKSIASAKTPGGGSSTSTPSVTQFAAPQMFGLGQGQITNPTQFANQRVYVTESDITSTQNRVKTIENSAILGH